MEIKSSRTSYEVTNKNENGDTLTGSITVVNNEIKDASFRIANTSNKQVSYYVSYYEDNRVQENVNGDKELIDTSKVLSRQTIEEFKLQVITTPKK